MVTIALVSNPLKLRIDKLVMGGFGLGRFEDGLVVLVPHVLPGETVLVQPLKKKKSYLHARLVDVLEPSSDRVSPPCRYYGRCGGCDFQHINSDLQSKVKNNILFEHMVRAGVLFPDDEKALLPPGQPENYFRYRQRIRLHVDKNGVPGYHRYHSHTLEPVKSCPLAVSQLDDIFSQCLKSESFLQLLERYTNQIELQYSAYDNTVVLFIHRERKSSKSEIRLADQLVSEHISFKAIIFTSPGNQPEILAREKQGVFSAVQLGFDQPLPDGETMRLQFEAGGFCQVNQEQNTVLINYLLDWAALSGKERVLDLFCGMGNFTLPLARKAESATGLDLKRSSIRSARKNGEINHILNCKFSQETALQGIKKIVAVGEKFDLVLLDPPRQGCADVIPYLPETGARTVIYISCDPATLSRDLLLLKGHGYVVDKMKMIDMFPQTHHMETMVKLLKL
jgi:23S rRNA (uracil1939-C5)-methyltransferase